MLILGATLAACSGRNEDEAAAEDPLVTRVEGQEDQFGKEFGKAFRADPNSEPANASAADVPPVSNTAEPLDVD